MFSFSSNIDRMSVAKDIKFSLKVMINKEKTKVLFAEADNDFVDVLLSFLTVPLGKVVKVLEKHYGDEAPVIGSLNTLYKGLVNLDSVHFWTEAGKQLLLNPRSSFETECSRLKIRVADDIQPPEYVSCDKCYPGIKFFTTSTYCDAARCKNCWSSLRKQIGGKELQSAGGVFTKNTTSYIIFDDLRILYGEPDLTEIISILGISDTDGTELMNVTFGFSEIMDLFKASLVSAAPLSDVILAKKSQKKLKSGPGKSLLWFPIRMESTCKPDSKKMILKVIVEKSTNILLVARAGKDFMDFLISFLSIPLGRIVSLLGSNNSPEIINNLYRSIADIDSKFFVSPETKDKLMKLKLPHGSISINQILPLTEECLPVSDAYYAFVSPVNFPEGRGNYVNGLRTYLVSDDLTVTPFCVSSTISMLKGLEIPISDVKEVELQIGLQEGLRILKASLTSTCVLTDALTVNLVPKKQPKQEVPS